MVAERIVAVAVGIFVASHRLLNSRCGFSTFLGVGAGLGFGLGSSNICIKEVHEELKTSRHKARCKESFIFSG
jgi:hypothetical protein